ncbi:MAG: ribosome silencing factor [Dehalococcoidia bacterium]|nr:ribosome silencing factor [Dehalococcoidia bacterium]
MPVLEPVELAKKIVDVASDKQATDVLLLDVQGVCNFTDYLVLCSADTERQISAVTREIERTVGAGPNVYCQKQGTADCGWVVIDMGSVVVHVFSAEKREYYGLESLWNKAVPLVRMQ